MVSSASGYNEIKLIGLLNDKMDGKNMKFEVIVANVIRNNLFQSLKYLLSFDQRYSDNLIKQVCCYSGTIDSECGDSSLIKQTSYICSLVEHNYRDMWQFFFKKQMYFQTWIRMI